MKGIRGYRIREHIWWTRCQILKVLGKKQQKKDELAKKKKRSEIKSKKKAEKIPKSDPKNEDKSEFENEEQKVVSNEVSWLKIDFVPSLNKLWLNFLRLKKVMVQKILSKGLGSFLSLERS